MTGYEKKKYVWKMLYIYMLGYDVEYGQTEAIALMSAPKYAEKQVSPAHRPRPISAPPSGAPPAQALDSGVHALAGAPCVLLCVLAPVCACLTLLRAAWLVCRWGTL